MSTVELVALGQALRLGLDRGVEREVLALARDPVEVVRVRSPDRVAQQQDDETYVRDVRAQPLQSDAQDR